MVLMTMWMSFAQKNEPAVEPEQVEQDVARLLTHRYADGLVYLGDQNERSAYRAAIHQGFINAEGYLTPLGRSLSDRLDSE